MHKYIHVCSVAILLPRLTFTVISCIVKSYITLQILIKAECVVFVSLSSLLYVANQEFAMLGSWKPKSGKILNLQLNYL